MNPRRLLQEPLIPFLLVGALCYFAFARNAGDVIELTPEIRAALAEDHLTMHGRPPTDAELDALVERWIADEILFREALARDLHIGDVRTRHRLVDKMRFLLVAEPQAPDGDTLRNYYLDHAQDYRSDWRLSFDHRYWPDAAAMPEDAIARLTAGEDIPGADYWLGDRFDAYHLSMLRSVFGGVAARRMVEAPVGAWIGPLQSPRGVHLVRITERVAPQAIAFADAEERIAEDWIAAERRRLLDAAVSDLRSGYEIARGGRDD